MTKITSLNWGIWQFFYLIIVFLVGFLITLLILPYIIKYMKNKGNVGYDIHKNARPEVAESGGLSITIGLVLALIISMILFPIFLNIIIIFILTIILAAIIGLIDDFKKLRSRHKILLTLFTGGIIFIANYIGFIEISSPNLPFLGLTRVTLIYPFLIPIIVAIFANTTNMMEGYNGEGSGTCLIAVCALFVCGIILNSAEAILFTLIAIAVLIPFFMYNKYPSKTFPGDVGTLTMGVMIACIALFASIEIVVFCAFLMHIFNSFYVLSSVRGFLESSKIQELKVDTILLEDDTIKASDQKDAALTLPRLILAKGPLTEKELINNFFAISFICGYFSIMAALFIGWTTQSIDLSIIIIVILMMLIPIIALLVKFKRIRAIVFLMIGLLITGVFFLIFIDLYIMSLPFADVNLLIIKLPINFLLTLILLIPGLLLWYYISIKWFWLQFNRMNGKNKL